eukprot:15290516-Alexandrium_andersonii.AAC.1
MQRDWASRKAFEMVKNFAGDRNAECDWRERQVKVTGTVVFKQERSDLTGSFIGECKHLRLP